MSIQSVRAYPLSDGDIRELLGDDIKIITYPELEQMRSIDECFDRKGRCIILFLTTSPTEGHWCCMMKRKNGIYFYDPYGEAPEEQKDGVSTSMLEQLNQRQPFLTELLRGSARPVFYNTHGFQKERDGINTCGRHCVVRLMYSNLSTKQYKDMIDKSGLCPDDFVSGVVYEHLHK